MAKRVNIKFEDDYMFDGARDVARKAGMSLSEYVTRVVGEDIKARLGYRIEVTYNNGNRRIENDFYSYKDLVESVKAFEDLRSNKSVMYDGSIIDGYEVYRHNILIIKNGRKIY